VCCDVLDMYLKYRKLLGLIGLSYSGSCCVKGIGHQGSRDNEKLDSSSQESDKLFFISFFVTFLFCVKKCLLKHRLSIP